MATAEAVAVEIIVNKSPSKMVTMQMLQLKRKRRKKRLHKKRRRKRMPKRKKRKPRRMMIRRMIRLTTLSQRILLLRILNQEYNPPMMFLLDKVSTMC